MQVKITLSGPQGAGKSVIGDTLTKLLQQNGMNATHHRGNGSRAGHTDSDTVIVETSPATLANLHRNR